MKNKSFDLARTLFNKFNPNNYIVDFKYGTDYMIGDKVLYKGNRYVSVSNHNDEIPGTSGKWDIINENI